MKNSEAYELLVNATKATFNATGRSWDHLSDVEKGERIQAQRAGFKVVLENYEANGYGQRTAYMKKLVEATDGPQPLNAEEAVNEARSFFQQVASGRGASLTADAAARIVAGLDAVELADED